MSIDQSHIHEKRLVWGLLALTGIVLTSSLGYDLAETAGYNPIYGAVGIWLAVPVGYGLGAVLISLGRRWSA